MNKCRICLESKRNVCSIHESDQGLSYASMITLITGIKIAYLEKSNVICLPCRRKLKDFLEFKHLIERSDHELCQRSKIIKYNTVDDLKNEFLPELKHKEPRVVASEYNNLFQNENDCIRYNDILIRRLKEEERKCVPIEEFLNTIKSGSFEEENYVDDYEKDANVEEEYNYKSKRKTSKKAKHLAKSTGPLKQVNNIHIKPILLKDVRVLKTFIKPLKRRKLRGCKPKETAICPFCGKICKRIKSHILRHTAEKKFKCEACPRSFYTNIDLTSHRKAAHGNIKQTFKCDNCIFSCTSRSSILSHMEMHMQKTKQFSCAVCKKEFRRKGAVQRHMLIHTISRSVECGMCGRTFHNRDHLNHHLRVHTGERPYKCELCSQPYSYKRDFNRHCLKKHGVLVDRRPVYVMTEEVLRKEKALMRDLMLHLNGLPTETDPLDSFRGPQMSQAFAKAVTMMRNGQIPIDVDL